MIMPATPKVSIVLPIHNAGQFLQECIDSITKQTFSSWELLAIEDHSDDVSHEILLSASALDSRVRIHENPGQGVVDALNYGIGNARGELIARMDADDLMCHTRIEEQVNHLEKDSDLGLSSSLVTHFPRSQGNERKGYEKYVQWTNSLITRNDLEANRFVDCTFAHPSVMFRKTIVEKFGGYSLGEFPEDFELWLRWMKSGVLMEKIEKNLLKWRDHPGRLSRRSSRYSQEAFNGLKVKYLKDWINNQLDGDSRSIFAWGAGKVAKKLSSLLLGNGIPISEFIDTDPMKIGRTIHGLPVRSMETITSPNQCFILILAGARETRAEISQYLHARKFLLQEDYLPLA